MTKKDTYISMRNAGRTREEVREAMGMSDTLEQKYNSLYYRDVEARNRKAVEALTDDQRIDGTPKLTPAEAERKIAETLGLVEYAPEAHAAPEPETPAASWPIVIVGRYMEFSLDAIGTRCRAGGVEFHGTLAEYGAAIAAEMAAVDRALRGIRL